MRKRSAKAAPATQVGFQVWAADPPWAPGDQLPGKSRGSGKNYQTMTPARIATYLDNEEWAGNTFRKWLADDALLFLWRLSSMQEEALMVARAWGFVPKTEIVWQKLTKEGKPWFGMGRYTRASHETCLVCERGRGKKLIASRSVRSTFVAKVPTYPEGHPAAGKYIHSAKPDEFYEEVVDKLVLPEASRIELFARRRRVGWSQSGLELESVEAA